MLTLLHNATVVLAWRPILEPINLGTGIAPTLLTLIPLVVAIAIVYKTLKLDDLGQLPRQALSLSVWIVGLLVVAAGGLWMLTELVSMAVAHGR